uniref:STAS domain-containing protein n=1 Tax=Rhabditophanes sp. KR3021 TaxID=114890 RepID=A0AC35TFK8_9BILA
MDPAILLPPQTMPMPPVQLMTTRRLPINQEEFDAKFEFLKAKQQPKRGSISTLDHRSGRLNVCSQFLKCCFNVDWEGGDRLVATSIVGVISSNSKDITSDVVSGHVSNKSEYFGGGARIIGQTKFSIISKFIPLLETISLYSIKNNLFGDIVGGLIIGGHAIAESLALAFLAGIEPIFGLYSCFLAFLINSVLGRVSCGGFGINAIIMYMVKCVIEKTKNELRGDSFILSKENETNLEMVSTLLLLISATTLLMLMCNLLFVIEYLPRYLLSGFVFGMALKIFFSQYYHLVQLPSDLPIKNFTIICLNSTSDCSSKFNAYTVSISISCLIFFCIIRRMNENIIRPLISFRVPVSIFIILFITFLSRTVGLEELYKVETLKLKETAFTFSIPNLKYIPYLWFDGAIIAIVSFALHQIYGKKILKKSKTETCQKHEMFMMTLINLISTFLASLPTSHFNQKSINSHKSDHKTPLVYFFSALMLIPAIIWSNILFSNLPKCVLSTVIVTSAIDSIFSLTKLPFLWTNFKADFFTWVVNFVLVLFMNDPAYAIFYGTFFAMLMIVIKVQIPNVYNLVNVTGSGAYYAEKSRYDSDFFDYENGIGIVRFEGPLLYNSALPFKNNIFEFAEKIKGNVQPIGIGTRTPSMKSTCAAAAIQSQKDTLPVKSTLLISGDVVPTFDYLNMDNNSLNKVLILDCSAIIAIDSNGMEAIVVVYKELLEIGVKMYFAHMSASNRDCMQACQAFSAIPKSCFFPSIHDAILSAHQISGNCPPNIHMSVSMHGCRDLITLSTAPSNQNLVEEKDSMKELTSITGRDSSLASLSPRPSLPEPRIISNPFALQTLRATNSNS